MGRGPEYTDFLLYVADGIAGSAVSAGQTLSTHAVAHPVILREGQDAVHEGRGLVQQNFCLWQERVVWSLRH